MTNHDDALTNLLKTELSSVNQGILKKRKSLADLLKHPVFEEGDNTVEIDKVVLDEVASKLTSPCIRGVVSCYHLSSFREFRGIHQGGP